MTLAAAGPSSRRPVPTPPAELLRLCTVSVVVPFTERLHNCEQPQAVSSQYDYRDKIFCSKHRLQVRVMWRQQANVCLSIIMLSLSKLTEMRNRLSMQCSSDIPKSIAFFEGSQASPVCPSCKNNIKMKMSIEQWWNYTDKGKPKLVRARKVRYVSVHVGPSSRR